MSLSGRDASHLILHALIGRWQEQSERALETHATHDALERAERNYHCLLDQAIERLVTGEAACPDLPTWKQAKRSIALLQGNDRNEHHEGQLEARLEQARSTLHKAITVGAAAAKQMREAQQSAATALKEDARWNELQQQVHHLRESRRKMEEERNDLVREEQQERDQLMSNERIAKQIKGIPLSWAGRVWAQWMGDARAIDSLNQKTDKIQRLSAKTKANEEVLFARENEITNYKTEKIWQDPGVQCANLREAYAWRSQNESKEQVRILEVAKTDLARETERDGMARKKARQQLGSQIESQLDAEWDNDLRKPLVRAREERDQARETHQNAVQIMTVARLTWSLTHDVNSKFIEAGLDRHDRLDVDSTTLEQWLEDPGQLERMRNDISSQFGVTTARKPPGQRH